MSLEKVLSCISESGVPDMTIDDLIEMINFFYANKKAYDKLRKQEEGKCISHSR